MKCIKCKCEQEEWEDITKDVNIEIGITSTKETLGYLDESILICGMALGYEDTKAQVNSYRTPREEIDIFTRFYE